METRYTNLDAETPKKRGPKPNPEAKQKHTLLLRPKDWEYLKQWQSENDAETNYSLALERLIEEARHFFPGGPRAEKPRGPRGWWLPGNGTSRNAQTRERRRLAREAALAEEESDALRAVQEAEKI